MVESDLWELETVEHVVLLAAEGGDLLAKVGSVVGVGRVEAGEEGVGVTAVEEMDEEEEDERAGGDEGEGKGQHGQERYAASLPATRSSS